MGQYKGKREMPKSENGFVHWRASDNEDNAKQQMNDPFAEEKVTLGERLEDAGQVVAQFFRSKTGKIITTTLCCVLALAIGGLVALKSWVKPPEIPTPDTNSGTVTPSPDQNQQPSSGQEEEPPAPTDDELYPDDGYEGDMPEVSGKRKDGEYTFLLVGTDKDDGNTDTIMVVNYNTVKQTVNVMSIPRDTMINESWDIKKINSVYSRTGNSINALSNRVKKLIGFKPDFYVKVELSMFVELVDLVDGVDFYVPCDMNYDDDWQDLHIHLKEGQQTLDGDKAMQLVRFRGYSNGDIGRVQVQQDFIKALIKECLSIKHWGKIKAYIDLALDNVQTDLDFGSVVWFAANVMGLNDAPMLSMDDVYTCTLPGNYFDGAWCRTFPNAKDKQSYVTIYPNKVVSLVNERFNPYQQKVTTDMLDAMSILENGDIASSTGALKDTKHNEWMAVRRGEAYYDEEGNIVYGDPNGEMPGEPGLPGEGGDPTTDPTQSGDSTDPDQSGDPTADPTQSGETSGDPDQGGTGTDDPVQGGDEPSEPELPDENGGDSESSEDDEMPEWLRP